MTPSLTKEAFEAICRALEEVDAQLVHEIRTARTDRARLLSELDVLQKVRDRIYARTRINN